MQTDIDKELKLKLSEHCVFKQRGKRGFIMFKGQSQVLNQTASEIIALFSNGERSTKEILSILKKKYPQIDVETDALQFIQLLMKQSIITPVK